MKGIDDESITRDDERESYEVAYGGIGELSRLGYYEVLEECAVC